MLHLFVSVDTGSTMSQLCASDDVPAGLSSLSPCHHHAEEDIDCVLSNAETWLQGNALILCDSCSLHGVPPELLGDNEHSFRWMVSHLFKGDCVCVTDLSPGLGLYEDSACAEVTSDMNAVSQIVSHVIKCVVSRVAFYSTDSLHEIMNVHSCTTLS